MSERDTTVENVKRQIGPKVPCVKAGADGYCKEGGFVCCECDEYQPVKAVVAEKGRETHRKATMKQPTYKMERIALANCKPHADAEAYSASSEDRAALTNSINESGLLSPIAVVPDDAEGGVATQYYVIDGIGRMNALIEAGVTETEAQVFDLGDLSVAEFVVCKNAMMRKVTTGTRVMAYLKCHEREVLAAADPEKYASRKDSKWRNKVAAVSHDTAGGDKGWSSKEIAQRIGVSNHDVLAGIELLKASAEGDGDGAERSPRPTGRAQYEQMDLFETVESVLRGETPIRRWKACAGGKVSKIGGKAAADYTNIALRTMRTWKTIFENWQTVEMDHRQSILDEFRCALFVIPDDFLTAIELVLGDKFKGGAKAKKSVR